MKHNKLLTYPLLWVILLSLLTLALVIHYVPGRIALGDSGYKYLQTRDLLLSSPGDISCTYPGKTVDPEMKFILFRKPFFYTLKGRCYYVFPYQISFLYLPFYAAAGVYGIQALTYLSIVGILFALLIPGRALGLSNKQRSILLAVVWAAGALEWYAIGINEYAFTALLVTLSLFLLFKESPRWWLLAGALSGLAIHFRAETAALMGIVPVALLLSRTDQWKRRSLHFLIASGILFFLFLAANQLLYGYPLGLKQIEFMERGSKGGGLRLTNLAGYLFLRKTSLLQETPVLLLSAVAFFKAKNFSRPSLIRFLTLVSFAFIFAVAMAVNIDGGPRYGERFIFAIYPVMAFAASLSLFAFSSATAESANPEGNRRRRAWMRRGYGIFVALLVLFTLRETLRWTEKERKIDGEFYEAQVDMLKKSEGSEAVILRHRWLANLAFYTYHDRLYFLADTDAAFATLIEKLKENGIGRITVIHSRPPFRGPKYGVPGTLVPADFRYLERSEDLGGARHEMRNFKILPSPPPRP